MKKKGSTDQSRAGEIRKRTLAYIHKEADAPVDAPAFFIVNVKDN